MERFSETQRFSQWWLWLILGCAALLPVIIEGTAWQMGKQDSISATAIGVSVVMSVLFTFMFSFLLLRTWIGAEGVSYQFSFFHRIPVKHSWDDIAQAYVRQYKPLREFGGWGIRYGMKKGRGMAFNISGNKGLQLVLKNGKNILIGTRRPDEIHALLTALKNSGKIDVDVAGQQPAA
jgi:hypothetical protein